MDKTYQYIKDITEASRKGKLVFFIGAGVSTLSDYPQWRQLVDKYHAGLYGNTKEGGYSSDEYLRIPQIFYDVKGEEEFDKILEEVFSVEKSSNPIHDKILSLNPVHIITTNYDSLIDKACWKRGKYFSVISAEEDVAKATSSRFLLKVHGDFRRGFKGENIVLKEADYVNYDQDYPLISNLMKTIMATHTIVFIGYGLGDYNINSLLNWVKKLQKDGYNKPYFIRTDPKPIEQNTAIYYERKGLRILDAATLKESDEKEYMERYSTVMDLLIESRENGLLSNDGEIIEYIYEKLSPLFVLKSIRKLDLKHVFEYDYHFEVDGRVIRHKNEGFGYMERFFELKASEDERDKLSEEQLEKLELISSFFEQNNIIDMSNNSNAMHVSLEINNLAYHGKYNEMEKFIEESSINIEDNYKKAFFLAYLGRWEEAYNLYSEIILNSLEESNWWIHYLSQINRYRIYQSITQSVKQLNTVGALTFGKLFKPFNVEFLTRIEREMKNFSIDDVFKEMPFEFQKKYKIMEFLSDNEFLYNDTVKLFELTNKVRTEMSKGSYSFGITNDTKVLLRLYENVRFLFENSLWAVSFQEFNQYVKNSMILLIEKAEYERTRDIDEFGLAFGGRRLEFSIDYYDFINMSKALKVNDMKDLERRCSIKSIEINDQEKIEEYLIRIAEEIIKNFSTGGMEVISYTQFIPEAKAAFYLGRYVKLSENGLQKIVRALLFYFPERDLDIGERYKWIERLSLGSGLSKEVIYIIEEFLISQADRHKDDKFSEKSTNNFFSRNFCNLISYHMKGFVSNSLSEYALTLSKEMTNLVDFMYCLSPILSNEAKTHLLSLKEIKGIRDLMDSVQIGVVSKIEEYQNLILNYMEERRVQHLSDRKKGVVYSVGNNYMVKFGIWYFLGELNDPKMKDYIGIEDEYDLFVDPKSFDYDKFRPSWLKQYNELLLEKMAQNDYIRPNVIEILKERIKNTDDKQYLEIFINHFM